MKVIVTECSAPDGWDQWLVENGASFSFCQTMIWAKIIKNNRGNKNIWVEVLEGGERIVGALFTFRNQSEISFSKIGSLLNIFNLKGGGALTCIGGPIILDISNGNSIHLLLNEANNIAHQVRASSIQLKNPHYSKNNSEKDLICKIFKHHGFSEHIWKTTIIDLMLEETKLFDGLKRSVRKAIKKCNKAGVEVKCCNSFDEYYNKFALVYFEDNIGNIPARSSLCKSWDLAAGNDSGKYYRYFYAIDSNGRVLATLGTYSFLGVATEIMSHRTQVTIKEKIPAQDIIHWEIIKFHKALGDKWFDLAGYSPAPKTPKEEGIRRFKQKWGGKEIETPTFILNRESVPLHLARKIRNWLRVKS